MHNAFPLVSHNGTAAKVKTSRCNENRLVRLGRPDEGANGQPFVRVSSRAVDGAGALEEEGRMTSPPFIITSNHYGNSVRMYREVGAYCIRPLKGPAWGV